MTSQFDDGAPSRGTWRTTTPASTDTDRNGAVDDLLAGPDDEGPDLTGVYSSNEQMTIGWGTTQRKVMKRVFYYVEQDEHGRVYRQVLDADWMPGGERQQISREDAISSMLPEPDAYFSKVLPRLNEFRETLQRGDMRRSSGELYSAEFEYKQALEMQDGHVRAMFGLGLVYLDREDTESARQVFERLVAANGTFNEEHKHLFNEYGIELRKAGLLNEALKYYIKAFRMDREDDHLQLNIARVLYEKGKPRQAVRFLQRASKINPNMPELQSFLRHLQKHAPNAFIKGKELSKSSAEHAKQNVLKTTGLDF